MPDIQRYQRILDALRTVQTKDGPARPVSDATQMLIDLWQALSELQQKRERQDLHISELEQTADNLRETMSRTIEHLNAVLREWEARLGQIFDEKRAAEERVAELDADLEEARGRETKLHKEIAGHISRIGGLEHDVEMLEAQLRDQGIDDALEAADAQMAAADQEDLLPSADIEHLEGLREAVRSLTEQLRAKEKDVRDLDERVKMRTGWGQELETEVRRRDMRIGELEETLRYFLRRDGVTEEQARMKAGQAPERALDESRASAASAGNIESQQVSMGAAEDPTL